MLLRWAGSRQDLASRRLSGRALPTVDAVKGWRTNNLHIIYLVLILIFLVWSTTVMHTRHPLPDSKHVLDQRIKSHDQAHHQQAATSNQPLTKDPVALLSEYLGKGLGLQRSSHAIALERALDIDENVGACIHGQPVFDAMDPADCGPLHCMWSDALRANVDLWFNAFDALDPALFQEPCHRPRGGQQAAPPGAPTPRTPPQLAIVITVVGDPKEAAQSLLEAFRVAAEVESAEIVLVDAPTTRHSAHPHLLRTACTRLSAFFNTRVTYLPPPPHPADPAPHSTASPAPPPSPPPVRGAHAATAELALLIRSDALLMKGAVHALVATLLAAPSAAAVGPLLIGPDNRVAAAGGVLFNRGEAIALGRGHRVVHALNFRRPADFLPGACLLVRRKLFLTVGGFDPQYQGAAHGYADADLGVALRQAGHQVLYQSVAVVFTRDGTLGLGRRRGAAGAAGQEGVADGGATALSMNQNRARLMESWGAAVRRSCPVRAGSDMGARRMMSPKLLWIDDIVPEPDHDSGSIRTLHMLQILLENGYDVAFQPTATGRLPRYTQEARFLGVDVLPVLPPAKWDLGVDSICRYDVILVARRYVFEPIRHLLLEACPETPVIYDTVDLHFLRESRDRLTSAYGAGASTAWNFSTLSKAAVVTWLDSEDPAAADVRTNRDIELGLIDHSRLTIVVSDTERSVIQHYRPHAKVAVISNIHTPAPPFRSTCGSRRGIMFVGNLNHPPNRQAIEELLLRIVPRVRRLLPDELAEDFVVHVVGANQLNDAPELRKLLLGVPGTQFHGYLPDELLKMLYLSVKAVAAPLLSGAGVKGKVNQAMNYGVPVVATPIAVEAMHVEEGSTCLVGRSVEEFARKLVKVYTDCQLWEKLAAGGLQNIQQYFSVEAAYQHVLQAFIDVGAGALPVDKRESCGAQTFDSERR